MNRARNKATMLLAAVLAMCTAAGAQATQEVDAGPATTKPSTVIVVRVEELRALRADSKRAARLEDEVRLLREKVAKLQVVIETLRTVNDKLRASRKRAAATKPISDRWRGQFAGRPKPEPPRSKASPLKLMRASLGYDVIGTPQVTLLVKNVSGWTITAYEVTIHCFDRFDRPVKVWDIGSHRGRGLSQETLAPGSRDSATWMLYLRDTTAKVKIVLDRVKFAGGGVAWSPGADSEISIEAESDR